MRQAQKKIFEFLAADPLGTLATISSKGLPELSVVYFMVDPDLRCHILTKTNTRKYSNAVSRPLGTLLTYTEEHLTSVEIVGKFEIVEDTMAVVTMFERFQQLTEGRRKEYWLPPVAQLQVGSYVVLTLKPKKVTFRTFAASKAAKKKMAELTLPMSKGSVRPK